MTDNDDHQITDVAQEILHYLKSHPDAADTLHGITDWWIMRQHLQRSIQDVHTALEYLVSQDLIAKHEMIGGELIYERKKTGSEDE